MMVWESCRRRELEDLADFIATEDGIGIPVNVAKIAKDNGISYSLNDYQDYFDGMLECEEGIFHIYINTRGRFGFNSPRIRFSFAHELGHYFIDEHRLVLEGGVSLHHPSKYSFNEQRDPVEKEADYFASCLLMPRSVFSRECGGGFSFEKLDMLRKRFCTSLSATASRYMEMGSVPIALVCVEKGKVKYKLFSNDFPYKRLKTDYSNKVPPLTCAGDFFENGVVCDGTELVDAQEWFQTFGNLQGIKVHEHCVYQEQYGQTLSILWFD